MMSDPESLSAGGRPFRIVRVHGPSAPPTALAYTFFNQEGLKTASHLRRIFMDTWDRSVHNRIDRWVMVTVGASAPGSGEGFDPGDPALRRVLLDFLEPLGRSLP